MSEGTLIHIEHFMNNLKIIDMKKVIFILLLICAVMVGNPGCTSDTERDIIDICTMTISVNGEVRVDSVNNDEEVIPNLLADSTIVEAVLVSTSTSNPSEPRILRVKGEGMMKVTLPNEKFRWARQYYIMTAINKKGEISFYPIGDESSALDSLMADPSVTHLLVSYLTNTGKIGIFNAKGEEGKKENNVFEQIIN